MSSSPPRRHVGCCLLLALPLVAGACGGPAPRPDLLLVSIDTLRADRLVCYGGPAGVGDALCRIGEDGARYVWALSTAPSTAPAVASILTSRYPSGHLVTPSAESRLADPAVTLAEQLRSAGYATAAFVCNPVLHRARRFDRGFEIYDAHMTRRERNRPALRERDARSATRSALSWVEAVGDDTPWFLWIHYQDPHGPYEPPDARPIRDPDGARRLPVLPDHSGRDGIPAYQALPGLFAAQSYARRYLDEIRFLDQQISQLMEVLDRRPRRPGVLITADHGEAFGEDGYWFAHGQSLGLEQIRVPLLWRPPGAAAGGSQGTVISTPVSVIDVAPTLLAAAGLESPAAFEGRPLGGPVLGSRPDAAHRALFAEHPLRAALARGRIYVERDLRSVEPDEVDPISGGQRLPLAPRQTWLSRDGRALPPPDGAALDAALAHLHALGARRAPAGAGSAGSPSSNANREALRALGYLE